MIKELTSSSGTAYSNFLKLGPFLENQYSGLYRYTVKLEFLDYDDVLSEYIFTKIITVLANPDCSKIHPSTQKPIYKVIAIGDFAETMNIKLTDNSYGFKTSKKAYKWPAC